MIRAGPRASPRRCSPGARRGVGCGWRRADGPYRRGGVGSVGLVAAAAVVALVTGCASQSRPAFPSDDNTPLVRTDYSNEARWEEFLEAVSEPTVDGFRAHVTVVNHPALDGMPPDEIQRLPAAGERPMLALVADARALAEDGFPILVIDSFGDGRPAFRVVARCLWAVENNLSLANMDWDEFSGNVDGDGVFRGC